MPVGASARVATNSRGPGMTPRLIAVLTSTSAYIGAFGLHVAQGGEAVHQSAVRAATVARMVR